jgi:capsular exopolysaccharide synthesis family protein
MIPKGRKFVPKPTDMQAMDTAHPWASPLGEPRAADARDYLASLLRWRWLMLAVFVVVCGLGAAYTLTRRPVYEATAKIAVVGAPGSVSRPENDIPLLSDLQALTRIRSVGTQADIIASPELLQEAFDSLGSKTTKQGFGSNDVPGWAHNINTKRDTDIIMVSGRAYTPAAASGLANAIAETYFKRDVRQSNQITRQARQFAETKLAITAKELSAANQELADFKKQTGLFAPDAQITRAAENLAQLSLELDAARASVVAAEREVAALRDQMGKEKEEVVTSTMVMRNPQFGSILDRIDALNTERANLLQEFTSNSTEVTKINENISIHEARLKQVAETIVGQKMLSRNPVRDSLATRYATGISTLTAAGARAEALQAEIEEREQVAAQLPDHQREFAARIQRVAELQRSYDAVASKYHTLMMSEEATLPIGVLVARAQEPGVPMSPNLTHGMMVFALMGIVLGMLAAVMADRFDTRVHDQSSVERISGLETLAVVPEVVKQSPWLHRSNGHSGVMLESFRMLRNVISLSAWENPPRIIAVTSPGRGEGKSTTALNLAVAMAMEGKHVLLVDADTRRPSLHKTLGISQEPGLTNAINGEIAAEDAIVPTCAENVYCLPAGTPTSQPPELLNSESSRALFKRFSEVYDMVVVDCPPCAGLSDVQVVSTIVDGILLVVSMKQAIRPRLQVTMRMLAQTGAPLVGTVLNRVRMARRGNNHLSYYLGSVEEADKVRTPRARKKVKSA